MRRVALAGWFMVELEGSAAYEPKVFGTIKGWMISSDSVRFVMQQLFDAGPNFFPVSTGRFDCGDDGRGTRSTHENDPEVAI